MVGRPRLIAPEVSRRSVASPFGRTHRRQHLCRGMWPFGTRRGRQGSPFRGADDIFFWDM